MRDLSKQFEDKDFVKSYFRGVEDGQGVTSRLQRDEVTLNALDLIARLVGWLEEAEPSEESAADAQARSEQEVASLNLPSQQELAEKQKKEEADAKAGSSSSSDGTTRTSAPTPSKSGTSTATTGTGSKPRS